MDTKFSPDCLNVFGEGTKLKKIPGYDKLNTATVGVGSKGNGAFNWVKSVTSQLLMAVFDNKLYKMDISGTAWDGTFDLVSADASSGTPFSDSITHFATYAGTLLFTTEARDKPQKMTTTDSSHKNIESGGAGTSPHGKYIQVWKDHVWILNISAGGDLVEDCDSIAAWDDDDVGTAASTQVAFQGEETFRFLSVGTGSEAIRSRLLGTINPDFSAEIRTYFDAVTAVTGSGIAIVSIKNGTVDFQARFSDDGLEVFDGAAWNEVGVDLVSENAWITWKFLVTAGTATAARVDILKDNSFVALQYDISSASAATAGDIILTANGGTNAQNADWYMDFLYVNSINPKVDYVVNQEFDTFTGNTADNWSAFPTIPIMHFKMNDDAGNNTITDDGSDSNNAGMFIDATTLDTSVVSDTGKISKSINFTSASNHNVQFASASITSIDTDTAGTISFWMTPNGQSADEIMFSIADTNANSYLDLVFTTDFSIKFTGATAGVVQLSKQTNNNTVVDGSTHFIVLTQDGTTSKIFIDNVDQSLTTTIGTVNELWLNTIGTPLDNGRLGCTNRNSDGNKVFFNGKLDDVRYYSTALTTTELGAIYAEGSGTEGFITTVQEGTIVQTGSNSYELQDNGTYTLLTQTLGSGSEIAGVESILGIWVFGENLDEYKLKVDDGTTGTESAVFTANGTWQYQTLRFTPTSGATSINAQFIGTSGGTTYIDHVNIITADTEGK